MPPADSILGLKALYAADESLDKIDLTVGAYRTDEGKPLVLPAVEEAKKRLENSHEYLPIEGLKTFRDSTEVLIFGKGSEAKRITIQTLSGTGAVRLGFEFFKRFLPGRSVYLPSITWANHWNIARDADIKAESYSYLDSEQKFDMKGMVRDLENAPDGSIVLLHLCAHNPTGVDPTEEQWLELARVFSVKRHLPMFDSAYVGFASGDISRDVAPFRLFVSKGLAPWASVSFSKNFGLYSERVGALHATLGDADDPDAVLGHLKKLARAMYSNPPAFGARIVAAILADDSLKESWLQSLTDMSGRIDEMRHLLRSALEEKTRLDWSQITQQIGMFSFTGISRENVLKLRRTHHVYMLENGRISMAGVNKHNVDALATAISTLYTDSS